MPERRHRRLAQGPAADWAAGRTAEGVRGGAGFPPGGVRGGPRGSGTPASGAALAGPAGSAPEGVQEAPGAAGSRPEGGPWPGDFPLASGVVPGAQGGVLEGRAGLEDLVERGVRAGPGGQHGPLGVDGGHGLGGLGAPEALGGQRRGWQSVRGLRLGPGSAASFLLPVQSPAPDPVAASTPK